MRKVTKLNVFLIGCFLFCAAAWAGDAPNKASATADKKADAATDGIQWFKYDQGVAKAKAEGKPIVIDFYTDWCGYCKKMDRSTFKDPQVIAFLRDNFVTVRVNGEAQTMVSHEGEQMSERMLTQTYGVRGFPTFWFLDSEGKRIGPAPGFKPTETFLPLLRYVGGSHYKTMSYENFLKKETGQG